MQLEIEQKFRVVDRPRLEARLAELSARFVEHVEQQDTYYNHPSRDFRATGEALRIRRTGAAGCITYKGPKLDTTVKTRQETELELVDPQAWPALLEMLGFQRVATVTKHRDRYHLLRPPFELEVTVDDVGAVGLFAEVEIVADQTDAEAARAAVVSLAAELGLSDPEPRSYLRMFLEQSNEA